MEAEYGLNVNEPYNSSKSHVNKNALYIVQNKQYKLSQLKKKRNRRPISTRKKLKLLDNNFCILSHNVASLKSKLLSLSKLLSDLNPKIWALQETQM